MDYRGIGSSRIAIAFREEGVDPIMPASLRPIPRPGRDGACAYGHATTTYQFTIPKLRLSNSFVTSLFDSMQGWLGRFDVYLLSASGDGRHEAYRAKKAELWPILHVGFTYCDGKLSGSLDAWVVKNGKTGAAFIVRHTGSLYVKPLVTAEEKKKYPKDWRLVFALPWENPRRS